jgi:dUTP pyrophosphatase
MFLGSKEIKRLIETENLVSGYINIEEQLQPDGFDLTVNKIERFIGRGALLTDTKYLPEMLELKTKQMVYPQIITKDSGLPIITEKVRDIWELDEGVYLAYFNETIRLPKSVSSIHIQRSTFMRCGNLSIVGTWDMGYNGKGCTMIHIANPYGLVLEKNTRIVKMQFMPVTEGFMYGGSYQNENIQ